MDYVHRLRLSIWIEVNGSHLIIQKKSSKRHPRNKVLCKSTPLIVDYITAVISRKSENGVQYLLVQRPETGLLAGLWDFPNIPLEDTDLNSTPSAESLLVSHLTSLGLSNPHSLKKKGTSLHIFTHIRRTSQVYSVQVAQDEEAEGLWATEDEIAEMAVSELGRKVLRVALGTEKKRKLQGEKAKTVNRKVIKLEKGQTKLAFASLQKTASGKTEVDG